MNRDDELLKEQKENTARLKKLYFGARRGLWTWPTSGAVCGLAGGVIAAISGTLLLAIAWAIGDESAGLSLHGIGSILLLSTIPLLVLGACCLDLVEKREEKNQQSICKDAKGEAKLNGHSHSHVAVIALLLVLFCGAHSNIQAQQTVFNVPTTDVLEQDRAARLKRFRLIRGNDQTEMRVAPTWKNEEAGNARFNLPGYHHRLLFALPRLRARVRETAWRRH